MGVSRSGLGLTSAGSGDAGLSVFNLGDGGGGVLVDGLHVLLGKVAEAGVLGAGEELVVGELPRLAASHGQDLLQVVLHNHARGMVVLRDDGCGVTHFREYKLIL